MRKQVAAVIGVAALVFAGGASAGPLRYGAADDWPKFHPCGDVWWQSAGDIGLQDIRMTVQWSGGTTIPFQAGIQAAVDCALLSNMRPILAVYPARPAMIGSHVKRQNSFARFVALVGQTFPRVTNFVVGNEPNVNRFWQPQYVAGEDAAGTDYEHTLARSYDALKAVRPDSVVWGPAISSRGNDNPNARSNPSHSPVWFIKDLGDAYRASGRTRPIFDEFDMHPYPPQDTDAYSTPFEWPEAGAANLDRIKQALWDAFHGTHQRTPTEQAGLKSTQSALSARTGPQALPINLDEVGSQTQVGAHAAAYRDPPESVVPISEAQQAGYYVGLMEMAACDPAVKSLLFFPVIDEADLRHGFESGLLFADLTRKWSYGAVKIEIASSQGQCPASAGGVVSSWSHTNQVAGAQVSFGGPGLNASQLRVTATEAATFEAGLFKVAGGRSVTSASVSRAFNSLPSSATLIDTATGEVRAYSGHVIQFAIKKLQPGNYLYAVKLTAIVNGRRTTTAVSAPFKVFRVSAPDAFRDIHSDAQGGTVTVI